MAALDDKIDDLYKQPLGSFISARNALAKSLTGEDAKRVKTLEKPTVVPWAVNQVYWHARSAYDRLLAAGERLRKVQIAALGGKAADVRAANDAHRRAIADAVAEAERLASAAGSKPSPDALTRTFEALSLAPEPPARPGRLTEALQPSGFEALTGVHISAAPRVSKAAAPAAAAPKSPHQEHAPSKAQSERDRKREREEAEAARAADQARRTQAAALKKADAAVARAEANEKLARATWERAHDALLEARRERDALRRSQEPVR